MKPGLVAAVAVLLLAGPTLAEPAAQAQVPLDDPEATVVEELVVRAATPGPAWWKVTDADSTVWILGLPAGYTPTKLAWDRSVLQKRLTGAHSLLVRPMGSISIQGSNLGAIGVLARMAPGVRWTNGNIENDLPPALATRFKAARTRLGKSARRYSTPLPALAGVMLANDYLTWASLDGDPSGEAEAMAKKLKVPVARPATISAANFKLDEVSLDAPGPAACFSAMLDEVDIAPERHRSAAAGWAAGDVRTALNAPRDAFSVCENAIKNSGFSTKAITAQTGQIAFALGRPGKAVALVPLRYLVAEGGVIERLRAQGHQVLDPASDL